MTYYTWTRFTECHPGTTTKYHSKAPWVHAFGVPPTSHPPWTGAYLNFEKGVVYGPFGHENYPR